MKGPLARCLAAAVACALSRGAGAEETGPALGVPSVRLARIVTAEGKGGFLRWLTGAPREEALVRPYGVAWDGEDLLVTDPGARRVVRVTPRGKVTASPRAAFASPIGVAGCAYGIAVTDSERGDVTLLDRRLRPLRKLAHGLERPTGVACAGERLYVVETGRHRVLALAPDGSLLAAFGTRGAAPGELNFPAALGLEAGLLWVGDTLNFRVQAMRVKDGGVEAGFGRLGDAAGETPRVKGIAVDAAGRIFVSDGYLDRLVVFRRDGQLLGEIGRPGTGPGELSFPAGLAIHPDGRVAVADSLNRRVQVFRLDAPEAPEVPR